MSNPNLLLLPAPRHLSYQDSVLSLSDGKLIALNGADAQQLHFAATSLQQALQQHANTPIWWVNCHATASRSNGAMNLTTWHARNRPGGFRESVERMNGEDASGLRSVG